MIVCKCMVCNYGFTHTHTHKIEDLAQCFISVQDCGEQMAVVNFCGDSSGLGRFLVSALGHGHYSVLSTLQRNGVSPVTLGPLIP